MVLTLVNNILRAAHRILHPRRLDVRSLLALLFVVLTYTFRYNPISVEFFDTQVYPAFYGSSAGVNLQLADKSLPHKLSLMFMVLAIGSLMDSTLPAYNMEAEKYHQLARAALFQTSLLDLPTHYAVQALVCNP